MKDCPQPRPVVWPESCAIPGARVTIRVTTRGKSFGMDQRWIASATLAVWLCSVKLPTMRIRTPTSIAPPPSLAGAKKPTLFRFRTTLGPPQSPRFAPLPPVWPPPWASHRTGHRKPMSGLNQRAAHTKKNGNDGVEVAREIFCESLDPPSLGSSWEERFYHGSRSHAMIPAPSLPMTERLPFPTGLQWSRHFSLFPCLLCTPALRNATRDGGFGLEFDLPGRGERATGYYRPKVVALLRPCLGSPFLFSALSCHTRFRVRLESLPDESAPGTWLITASNMCCTSECTAGDFHLHSPSVRFPDFSSRKVSPNSGPGHDGHKV
ncbi:hypothetical protein BDP81DRAFT_112721 [Colletotrichum phormii]|uniref:Uncharacterized protein n=1 Tax=Colletotrichum phormii TaxID=359342 RepID=A0AAI9ZGN6_9PEZI|nr:uncharacterized protein BDP81DRAFT_112721 [Colletotrichum phormii]KAK1624237.1 hypothetical protein BDP81DRAFT_112721 [Colletotrichum phormii]